MPGSPHQSSLGAAERCWICLEELQQSRREWVYPCMCSLVCHEECLLHWVTESERRVHSGVVRCPQCSAPYKIVQWKSATFTALHAIYSTVDKTMPFFLATIGSMAVVVACTAYGVYAVMTVYGPLEGQRILWSPGKWDYTKWLWLPTIPMALVLSRFQISAAYMPLSTLLMTMPQPLQLQWPAPPSLMLSALPTISTLYRYVWGVTLGRLERRWESHLPQERDTLTIHGIGLQPDTNAPDAADEWPDVIAARADNAAANQVRMVEEQQQQQPGQPGAPNFEATIVLNGASLGRTLVESLLLPAISSAFGAAIGRLPFMRRPGLSHFSRVMVGGCVYFIVKDLIRMLYKYLLYRSRSSRFIKGRKRL
ncbi:hypothetical protein GGF46_002698 [Coemansia sp. RSA 552]|nr:hypothetical protein GGF46_002698 [Coemansia sp. RSA 552]